MRFLVDENLPIRLARWLRDDGFEADHVLDVDLGSTDDRRIADRASELGAVIVTKDRDFVPGLSTQSGPRVVWLRLGNMNSAAVVATCARAWPGVVQALEAGDRIVEVRQGQTTP